jgi:gamma-glutamyltranspeptidase/glutathione hydrolase
MLAKDEDTARIFLAKQADGSWGVPAHGALVVQKDLGRTLRALAKDGAKAFYSGAIAKLLAADMQRRGGLVTAADLAQYHVIERAPLLGSFRGLAVATAPPPSAGGHIVLTLLNALETFPAGTSRNDVELLHTYIEVSKRAFADRLLFGDPAFTRDWTPVLTTKERTQRLLALIPPRASSDVLPGEASEARRERPSASPDGGMNTTHLCAVDAEGNAVSMTTTVNYWFGAGIVARGTGVVWNDEMDDFAPGVGVANAWELPGSEANAIGPGRIPLSSMSPTIVFAGPDVSSPVRLVIGAPGGARIPMQVIQATYAHLALGEDVLTALALPKLHEQWMPDVVAYERFALDPATLAALRARGHVFAEETDHHRWGNGTAIAIDPVTHLRTGAADPRGDGAAIAQ